MSDISFGMGMFSDKNLLQCEVGTLFFLMDFADLPYFLV